MSQQPPSGQLIGSLDCYASARVTRVCFSHRYFPTESVKKSRFVLITTAKPEQYPEQAEVTLSLACTLTHLLNRSMQTCTHASHHLLSPSYHCTCTNRAGYLSDHKPRQRRCERTKIFHGPKTDNLCLRSWQCSGWSGSGGDDGSDVGVSAAMVVR